MSDGATSKVSVQLPARPLFRWEVPALSGWSIPKAGRCPLCYYQKDAALSNRLTLTEAKCPLCGCIQDAVLSNRLSLTETKMSVMWLPVRCRFVKLVKPESTSTNVDTSSIPLLESPSILKLVNPESGEISVTLFVSRFSVVRLVNPESGEMSVMLLFPRRSSVRLVANSSPINRLMEAPSVQSLALKCVKVAISSGLIGSPGVTSRAAPIAARRIGSGMCTPSSATSLKVYRLFSTNGRCRNAVRFLPQSERTLCPALLISGCVRDTECSTA